MSGSFAAARAAIKAQLHGTSVDLGADYATQELVAFEYAPPGRQTVEQFPYAFPLPAEVLVGRGPGGMRETLVDWQIRVMMAPEGEQNLELLQKYYDAWVVALSDAWDDAAGLDGAADISVEQDFSGLMIFQDIDKGWGFEMTLKNVRITEDKTFSQ